jgi:OmpA-OmpF porin, OOP family
MRTSWLRSVASLAVICLYFLVAIPTFGQTGDKAELQGIIVSRTGDTLIISNSKGKFPVVLTDHTITKDNKGILGLREEYMADTVLIPGLKLKVDGMTYEPGKIVADEITVDGDDLETAEMIQAGLHPTAQQVATNEKAIASNQQNISANTQQIQENMSDIQQNTDRFSQLGEYDVRADTSVNFDVGSSQLSPQAMAQLKQLAQSAAGMKGYIVEVKGFADSTGSPVMNEQLSEDRADAVVSYLIQQCSIPVRHIVAPGAMGEYQPAASNESAQGRATNRRVEVKVLLNKGIAGQ